MALIQKIRLITDISGDRFWVQDTTGLYDASTNAGGWGSPNLERSVHALLCYVVRHPSDGVDTENVIVANQIDYNISYDNTHQSEWQVLMPDDGHHTTYVIILPDSNATLVDGQYYYDPGAQTVMKVDGVGGDVPITDYSELIDSTNDLRPQQAFCEELFYTTLKKRTGKQYHNFEDSREQVDCDSAAELARFTSLKSDLQGTDYNFKAGLTVQAQLNIEKLLVETEDLAA